MNAPLKATEVTNDIATARLATMWEGEAKLYQLSEEVATVSVVPLRPMVVTDHIVVSSVAFDFFPDHLESVKQTYIFPADKHGVPMDMVHLKGSIDGSLDHHRAISNFISQHMKMEGSTDG